MADISSWISAIMILYFGDTFTVNISDKNNKNQNSSRHLQIIIIH